MEAAAGGSTDDIRQTRKKLVLAGVCSAALEIGCSLFSSAHAGKYTASNETELRDAPANAKGVLNSTIALTGSFSDTDLVVAYQLSGGRQHHGTV
jgi:hypothetical protein